MKTKNIRAAVLKWVQRDQKHNVLAELVRRRVAASTADQLVRGKYPQEPQGALRTVIESALAEANLSTDNGDTKPKVS